MCSLKKLASGVFPESWKVLTERRRRRRRKRTKNNKPPVTRGDLITPAQFWLCDIREVLLHVKRERVRVTSDSGAQIRYTSRSRTRLGFATRRDVSADKQAHRYQQMTRQQSIKYIRKQKWAYTA